MGTENPFARVKLFCGVIYRENGRYEKTREMLINLFSPPDAESDPIPFVLTDYYVSEMGAPLFRKFISFSRLIAPEQLVEVKRITNRLERETSVNGKRTVNLDPGFLSAANVIIATTKNHYHRIPLRDGIYAHMEYVIKNRKIICLEWTYPDFKTREYLDFFDRVRILYKKTEPERPADRA
jgi:hypothetical protein